VPSVWIRERRAKDGSLRHRVEYRPGGREAGTRFGGSFRTKREAQERRLFIAGELSACRMPDLRLVVEATPMPTLEQASDAWRASRVDVAEQTQNMHRSSFGRIFTVRPKFRTRRVDELTTADVADLVAALAEAGYKRETIRKTRTALSQTLDFMGVDPNPARDDRVKLPRERKRRLPVPLAEHVEQVASLVSHEYVLPLLIADDAGPRVSELVDALVGDVDEHRGAIRLREEITKQGEARYLDLDPALFKALVATLPPREDRDLEAPLFPGLTDANLRTAIARACKAAGVPHFSPHALRRRRGCLHYKRTGSLAEVAEVLGDTKKVAAEHYIYALTDYREIDQQPALARLFV
jgi:integrase